MVEMVQARPQWFQRLLYCDVESKWKNYHIGTFPGQSLFKNRFKQLLDDPKEARRYWKLKEEAQDHTLWRTQFRRGYGPVARQTTNTSVVLASSQRQNSDISAGIDFWTHLDGTFCSFK
jgi:hypothetical protein